MKRLDKFLNDCQIGSRTEVKNYIKKGFVTVDGVVVKKPELKISEENHITFHGKELIFEEFIYLMLHKPAGVVSATEDKNDLTVIDLLKEDRFSSLFPVGRLDKDTEGLLILTNDGMLGHRLTSPKFHVEKKYYVKLRRPLSPEDINRLETAVDIGEKKLTRPAKVDILGDLEATITITEGKFHQVKRMFTAVNNEVCYLKRISMGKLQLDQNLDKGAYRRLNEKEINYLKSL